MSLETPSRMLLINDFKEKGGPSTTRYDLIGISPDTTLLYYTYADGSDTTTSLRARDLRSGNVINVDFEPSDEGFTMSPDGTHFAFHRAKGELWVANTDGSDPQKIAEAPGGYISDGLWVDATHVAYVPNSTGIYLVSLQNNSVGQLSEADSLRAFDVAPDLTTVAYTRRVSGWKGYDGISDLMYSEDTAGTHFLGEGNGSGYLNVIAFAAGGDRLVYIADLAKHLILADKDGSNPRVVALSPGSYLQEIFVDSSGKQVLFLQAGVLKRLNLSTGLVATVGSTQKIPDSEPRWDQVEASVEMLVFGPDGQKIYALVEKLKTVWGCSD